MRTHLNIREFSIIYRLSNRYSKISSFSVSYFCQYNSFAFYDYNEKRLFQESITCREVNKEVGDQRSFLRKGAASPK